MDAMDSSAELLQRVREGSGPVSGPTVGNRPLSERREAGRRIPESLQRSSTAGREASPAGETKVPDSVRDVISSRGRSLDTSIQRTMEDRMGDSLGDVRIHTGPKAAQACQQINARAFTVGNHVAFNSGEYDPSSPEGQHVLAHELAHVRQQTGGAVSMLPQDDLGLEIDPDPALEREAEETAQRVLAGGELGIQRLAQTEVHVQRLGFGFGSLFGSSTSQGGGSGTDEGGPMFEGFDNGDLGETIATLIQNQQRLIDQLGGQLGDGGGTALAEAGAQEALKASATVAAAESMPNTADDAVEAVPTSLEEARSLIADIAGGSTDLIISAARTMANPRDLQSVAGDVLANGGGHTLDFLWTTAPKVAGAMILAFALQKAGDGLVKALKQRGSDIVSVIKSYFRSNGSESMEDRATSAETDPTGVRE